MGGGKVSCVERGFQGFGCQNMVRVPTSSTKNTRGKEKFVFALICESFNNFGAAWQIDEQIQIYPKIFVLGGSQAISAVKICRGTYPI